MSFSKSFTGTALAVIAALAAFPAEQRALDVKNADSDAVTDGHARQIDAGVKILTAAATAVPEDSEIKVSLYGDAQPNGGGQWGFQIQASNLPMPDAAENFAGPDAPGSEDPGNSESETE